MQRDSLISANAIGERFLAWARAWMDPEVVRDVLEPTVADVRHECRALASEPARRAAIRRGYGTLARTAALAWLLGTQRRVHHAPWWVLLAPVAVILLGWHALAPLEVHKSSHHILFGLVGTGCAFTLAVAPIGLPQRRIAWLALPLLVVLVFVTLFGVSHDGARRWLVVGPLTVHVAALLTPLFAIVASNWRSGTLRMVFIASCSLALALQPNPAMGVLWGAIAVASTVASERAWAFACSALGLGLAVAVGGLEVTRAVDVPLLVGTYNPTWAMLTMVGLTIPAGFAWWLRSRASRDGAVRSTTFAAALTAWPMLAYLDEGLVLLSYGGSMMVAYLCCVGMLLRSASTMGLARA